MKNKKSGGVAVRSLQLGMAMMAGPALADRLGDSTDLLCYGLSATVCEIEGSCETFAPWQLNLPDFVEVDLDEGTISTTEASLEDRVTGITTTERSAALIVLQGMQDERAFSWVISTESGEGTMTVSAVHLGVTVFTVCTPV